MTRKFRALGLTVSAVLVMGAVFASMAQAKVGFAAGSYPASLAGTPSGTTVFAGGGGTATTNCTVAEYTGSLAAAADSVQVQPAYSGCTYWGTKPVTIASNGCTYGWTVTALESIFAGMGTQGINCPGGKEIVMSRYESKSHQEKNEPVCVFGFPSQASLESIDFTNLGSGEASSVELDMLLSGVKANVLTGTKSACGAAAGGTVGFSIDTTVGVTALASPGGSSVGISFGTGGIYLQGQESGESAKQPKIAAEWGSETRPIGGDQTAGSPHVLKFRSSPEWVSREVSCSGVNFASELAAPANELSLSATYTGCVANPGNLPTTVSMKSCHYAMHVLNVGPPYAGNMDIACSKEGDAIETNIYENATQMMEGKPMCTYKVGAQTGLSSIGLSTVGWLNLRGVSMSLGLKGVAMTVTKGGKVVCGATGNNLEYTGGTTLRAL